MARNGSCLSLRCGAHAVAIYTIVVCVIGTIGMTICIVLNKDRMVEGELVEGGDYIIFQENLYDKLSPYMYTIVAVDATMAVAGCLLLAGVHNKNRCLMLPWLVLAFPMIALGIFIFVSVFVQYEEQFDWKIIAGGTFGTIIMTVINMASLIVVALYYRRLKLAHTTYYRNAENIVRTQPVKSEWGYKPL